MANRKFIDIECVSVQVSTVERWKGERFRNVWTDLLTTRIDWNEKRQKRFHDGFSFAAFFQNHWNVRVDSNDFATFETHFYTRLRTKSLYQQMIQSAAASVISPNGANESHSALKCEALSCMTSPTEATIQTIWISLNSGAAFWSLFLSN